MKAELSIYTLYTLETDLAAYPALEGSIIYGDCKTQYTFLVFYNGTEDREERSVLKLSDSFEYAVTQKEEPNLELKVLVLNINQGNNKGLCQ